MTRTRFAALAGVFLTAAMTAALVFPAAPALSVTVFADAPARGWYDSTGFHDGTNDNYCVGPGCSISSYDTRDYVVVDLTGYASEAATQGVTDAWVNFTNPGGYGSVRPLQLFAVTTPVGDLEGSYPLGATGAAIFDDLGNGTLYGSYTPATVGETPVTVNLDREGLLALTKHLGGHLAIGGSLSGGAVGDLLFGSSAGLSSSAVQVGLHFGTKTAVALKGPGKVPKGMVATFGGAISSADSVCKKKIDLQVTIGSRNITVTTTKKGTYSFRAKFKKKTDLRVFDPGTSGDGPPACAGSDAAKTVKVV